GLLCASNGFPDLIKIAKGLHDDQVRTGLCQRPDLLYECLARLIRLDTSEGRETHTQRPHVAGDQYLPERGGHYALCQVHAGTTRLAHEIFPARSGKFVEVRSKRLGNDYLSTSLDISPVDYRHDAGLAEVELSESSVKADAARMEHGPHGAIGE